ncbi:MAG: DUF2071 domain-containing protein [Acidimicrobiia bacterium]|nr:DUF2071 domain-containing protein [Acidimicrobiia bacterium]
MAGHQFLHWALDPDELQSRLPQGLSADTFDGCAWLSLSPVRVVDQAPFVFAGDPGGVVFCETNLRT